MKKYLLLAMLVVSPLAGYTNDSATAIVDNLAQFRFDKLGHPQIASDSIQPAFAPASRPHKLLVLPVRFTDKQYDRFSAFVDQDKRNRAYLQDLLFGEGVEGPRKGTLSHYYRHQSRGLYNITGDIHPVVELPRPLSYYGRPVQGSDGSWRSDEHNHELVKEALTAAYQNNPQFGWSDYDQWDPQDFDHDGVRDEPDGYIDHLVLVVAGKGQSSCQGLYKIGEKLNLNSPPDAVATLSPEEQECVNRIWPHRSTMSENLASGPRVGDGRNVKGGVELGDDLWVRDYNIQSEYTDISTFIHEFGHSLGLPDIYARQTNNSTGSWEAMSSTEDPEPQELSAWSRTVLGWMQPCVIRAPEFGGETRGNVYLKTMNEWSGNPQQADSTELCDAVMVILPPKYRDIQLGEFQPANGKRAAYTGQGNDMFRTLSKTFDLSQTSSPVYLEFDAWFEIEAEWDYLYVEAASDDGVFKRLLPIDKASVSDNQSIMPARKGHDGASSRPGFTGLSGDLDGDNKVESAPGCDPDKARVLAEERVGNNEKDPCSVARWLHAQFDLADYVGKDVTLRFTYFTDGAAVENGALIDNVQIQALDYLEDFERDEIDGWQNTGFTLSSGSHHLPVPHYYLLEYRDPYAQFAEVTNYDANMVKEPGFSFYPEDGEMKALNVNYRPGVVMWYANGSYLWSQNDPSQFGPGNGFLLVVDSTPQEFSLSAVPEQYYQQQDGFTWWSFDEAAQPWLEKAYMQTLCFQRGEAYYPSELTALARETCAQGQEGPAVESLFWQDRRLMYGYALRNELLPGAARAARKGNGSLFDTRIRGGKTQFRLYDRALRNFHAADAPFAVNDFAAGIETYVAVDGEMRLESQRAFAGVSRFSDDQKYQNPHLPFGGVDVPNVGFSYELKAPGRKAPPGSRVKIQYRWSVDAPKD